MPLNDDYAHGKGPNHDNYSTLECNACGSTTLVADADGWVEMPRGWWTIAVDNPKLENERRVGDSPFVMVFACSKTCRIATMCRILDTTRPTMEEIAVLVSNRWARET